MVVVAAGSIVASAVLASDSATVTVVDSAVVDSAIAVFAQATADSIVSTEADLADQSMVGTVDMAVGTVDTPDPSIAVTVVDTAVTADMVAEVAVAGKRV